jgi:transcription elongation factor Elf1
MATVTINIGQDTVHVPRGKTYRLQWWSMEKYRCPRCGHTEKRMVRLGSLRGTRAGRLVISCGKCAERMFKAVPRMEIVTK